MDGTGEARPKGRGSDWQEKPLQKTEKRASSNLGYSRPRNRSRASCSYIDPLLLSCLRKEVKVNRDTLSLSYGELEFLPIILPGVDALRAIRCWGTLQHGSSTAYPGRPNISLSRHQKILSPAHRNHAFFIIIFLRDKQFPNRWECKMQLE
jgi:hypothetical protein